MLCAFRFAHSQLRKSDFTQSKDLILSFFPHSHKVFTFAQLKPPLLCTSFLSVSISFFACVFDTSLRFCLLSSYSPSLLCTDYFDEPLLSLLPTLTNKALCVFYIFCCHPAPLEIRGPFFMHGFSECQLPTHLWIQQSTKEGWENQVFRQSHSSVVVSPQQQGTREEDETELATQ